MNKYSKRLRMNLSFKEEGIQVAGEKYCDYCGEIIFIGEKYFVHDDFFICTECAKDYAWTVFEQEAALKFMQLDQLLDLEDRQY